MLLLLGSEAVGLIRVQPEVSRRSRVAIRLGLQIGRAYEHQPVTRFEFTHFGPPIRRSADTVCGYSAFVWTIGLSGDSVCITTYDDDNRTECEKGLPHQLHPAGAPHCAGHSRDLGSRQRSAYQLIPEFRGARAQWNFTDHLVKPQQFLNGFKAPLHLHYIRPTLLWPSCGSSRAVLEKSSSRSTSDNITI